MKNNKKKSVYATVTQEEGVNYREIADTMTSIGFKMNHSSARNYVLRVMKKFASALIDEWDLSVDERRLETLVKSPQFQQAICDILQSVDSQGPHKSKRNNT